MLPSSPFPAMRVVIVDDEPVARRGVRLLLQAEADVVIVGEAGDADEAVQVIEREKPDLVFLDVQMPGGDGFIVLRRLGVAPAPAVIFITAYDEYALRAFEVHAIDYLLKPYEDARFRDAVDRARSRLRQAPEPGWQERLGQLLRSFDPRRPADTDAEPRPFAQPILVRSSGEIFFLKPEEIDWIEAEGDYMKFHVGAKTHLMRETMARLESRLDPRRFIRIHRSTIVNFDRIRKLSPSFGGEYTVVLHDGTKLKLSRGYQDRLPTPLRP